MSLVIYHRIRDSAVRSFLEPAYNFLFDHPLRHFYFTGWWAGARPAEMCAAVTGVPVSDWFEFPEVCAALLERRYASLRAEVACAAYVVAIFVGMRCLFRRLCTR